MGLFSNIVPSASSTSCTAIDSIESHPLRKMSIARSGNAIDTISMSITSGFPFRERNRNFPLPPFIISDENDSIQYLSNNETKTSRKNIYVDTEHETKVNFQLPLNRRPSIQQQQQQLTLRERIKGSPRFPHRIAPTSSLNALVESVETSGTNNFTLSFFSLTTSDKIFSTNEKIIKVQVIFL